MNRFLSVVSVLGFAASAACVGETADDPVETSSTQQDVKLGSVEANDQFGFSFVAADFDGDGIKDLAVSAIGEGPGSSKTTGSVFLYKGSAGGLKPWRTIDEATLLPASAASNDEFGYALAAGDFDGDGHVDLVISAPNAAVAPGKPRGGVVFVMRGSSSGPTTSKMQVLTRASLDGGTDTSGDDFGSTLTLDTKLSPAFLAIGAPGRATYGVVDVLEVDSSKPVGTQWVDYAKLTPPDDNNWNFGGAIAIAKFDGTGHRSVAVSAPSSNANAGKVYIFHSNGSGFDAPIAVSESSSFGTGPHAGDAFGATLAVGNVDGLQVIPGTPANELVIGAPEFQSSWGRLFVYRPDLDANNKLTGMSVLYGRTAGDGGIGASLAVADLDGDSFDDIVSGVPHHTNSTTGDETGELAIFHGASGGLQSPGQELLWAGGGGSSGAFQLPQDGDDMGDSLVIGDFNHDGRPDVIGGMPQRSDEGPDGVDWIQSSGAFYFFPNISGAIFPTGTYFDEGTQ